MRKPPRCRSSYHGLGRCRMRQGHAGDHVALDNMGNEFSWPARPRPLGTPRPARRAVPWPAGQTEMALEG